MSQMNTCHCVGQDLPAEYQKVTDKRDLSDEERDLRKGPVRTKTKSGDQTHEKTSTKEPFVTVSSKTLMQQTERD